MSTVGNENLRALAVKIAAAAKPEEKEAIALWIDGLLAIRAANSTSVNKARQAIRLTAANRVAVSMARMIARETKRVAWDDRGVKAKLGLSGAAAGIILLGGQSAGIAALGTAIGVPLWVVIGAGGAFVGMLYEEITGRKRP